MRESFLQVGVDRHTPKETGFITDSAFCDALSLWHIKCGNLMAVRLGRTQGSCLGNARSCLSHLCKQASTVQYSHYLELRATLNGDIYVRVTPFGKPSERPCTLPFSVLNKACH
jgi:hypothetical protein